MLGFGGAGSGRRYVNRVKSLLGESARNLPRAGGMQPIAARRSSWRVAHGVKVALTYAETRASSAQAPAEAGIEKRPCEPRRALQYARRLSSRKRMSLPLFDCWGMK